MNPVIDEEGTQVWYQNSKLHNLTGPAVIYKDGSNYWYINDQEYTFNEYIEHNKISKEDKLMLKLKYSNETV